MNKKKLYIAGGIVIGAVIITASVFYFFPEINPWREDVSENVDSPPKTIHNSINILNMEEFLAFPNKTGDGTQSNPYVIANLEITSQTGGCAISIQNCYSFHITLENITVRDIEIDAGIFGVMVENSRNFILRNIEITHINSKTTLTTGIFLSNVSDSTIINCNIHDFSVKDAFMGISTQGSCERLNITSNQIHNVVGETGAIKGVNCYAFGSKSEIYIHNNIIENFIGGNSIHGVYFDYMNDSIIEANLIRDFTGDSFVVGIRLVHSNKNKINDNKVSNVVAGTNAYGIVPQTSSNNIFLRNKINGNWISGSEPRSRAFYVYSSSQNNIFALNWIMDNTYVGESGYNNTWSSVEYFEPMRTYTMVGNYYSDHNIDGNPNFHYFLDSPKIITDSNNVDLYPIHFFALDFDGDGLNNYQETVEYGTNIWETDTDKDGLSDYDEIHLFGTNPLDPDTDEDGLLDGEDPDPLNPNNNYWEKIIADPIVIGLFLVGIGLVLNFFRHRVPKPKDRKNNEK